LGEELIRWHAAVWPFEIGGVHLEIVSRSLKSSQFKYEPELDLFSFIALLHYGKTNE
jgi:hypothetical protein